MNRFIACSACLAVLLAPCIAASAPRQVAAPPVPSMPAWPSDQRGLDVLGSSLVESWMAAVVLKDPAALEKLMQPCFQRVNFEGAFDRAAEIDAIRRMGASGPRVSDVHASRVGDALVVTCQVAITEAAGSGVLDVKPSSRLGVWQWTDGAWRLAAWASLHMPSPRPAPSAPRFAGDEALSKEGAAMVTRLLDAQRAKDHASFDAMMAADMQVINFRGQKLKDDMVKGADRAKVDPPVVTDARASRCGELTVVSCTLSMGQRIGFTTLPADPAPFLAVFHGTGESAKVIAIANTNRPK